MPPKTKEWETVMVISLFCIICGSAIVERYSLGRGIYYSVCRNRECIDTYLKLRKEAGLPIVSKEINRIDYFQKRNKERYDGFCGRCGKPLRLDFRNNYLRHGSPTICNNASTTRNSPKVGMTSKSMDGWVSRREPKPKPRIYLKPWQDPESLFCDTKFLETKILRKKISTDKECSKKKPRRKTKKDGTDR